MMNRWASASAPVLAVAAAMAMAPIGAKAQEYPAQDIHVICAFPPGSGADVLVRYFAEKVRPLTGKGVVVENRSGAAARREHADEVDVAIGILLRARAARRQHCDG